MKKERARKLERKKEKEKEFDLFPRKKKYCRFCKDKNLSEGIDYKNLNILERMINDRGKILSKRVTGNCAGHQRKVCAAIKKARFLSLIAYTK